MGVLTPPPQSPRKTPEPAVEYLRQLPPPAVAEPSRVAAAPPTTDPGGKHTYTCVSSV
jgi:hypothetical protein